MTACTPLTDVNHIVGLLTDCSKACRKLTSASDEIPQFSDVSRFIQLINNCAASCDLAVILIERKSHIIYDFLEVCEELSLECAMECSNYSMDLCVQCAEKCEKVAKACLPFILNKNVI